MKIKNFRLGGKQKKLKTDAGFSLTEVVIVVAITGAIFLAVFNFGQSIFSFNSNAQKNLSAQSDARRILKTFTKELRGASPSSLGSYPIVSADATSLAFFSNIDTDVYKEQVRYFLQGTELKRGVIKPSGSPLSYDPSNETVVTLIRDIKNGATPIFEYFDNSFTGTSTPLSEPTQITKVRLVRITVKIEKDSNKSLGPFIATSQVFLRNLKDNL